MKLFSDIESSLKIGVFAIGKAARANQQISRLSNSETMNQHGIAARKFSRLL